MAKLYPRVDGLYDLEGIPIPEATRERFTAYLKKPSRKLEFRCKTCRKFREHPYMEDPGVFKVRELDCTDVNVTCDDWPDVYLGYPGSPRKFEEFLPGSLVISTPCEENHPTAKWPAIVEFSTDERADYCTRDDVPRCYYVTFIGRGCGGWYSKFHLVPFEADLAGTIRARNQKHLEVLELCRKYLEPYWCGLRRRLIDLSHVGAKLRSEKGVQLPPAQVTARSPTPIQLPNVNEALLLPDVPIPDATRSKLMAFLRGRPENVWFECGLCGRVRKHAYLQDPGWHQNYDCRDANMSCMNEEGTFHRKSRTEFLPGSLVCLRSLGAWDWPAIVEFSTDEHADYCVRSSPNAYPQAYYITFIGADRGGWFEEEYLTSFRARITKSISEPGLANAIALCASYLRPDKCDLRRRLLHLSWAATQLRKEGFELPTWKDLATQEENF